MKAKHRMQACVAIIVVLMMNLPSLEAQGRQPAEPLKLFVDFSRFRGTDRMLYVEFYYSFSQRSLTYVVDEQGLSAAVDLSISISRGDSSVFTDRWIVPHSFPDTNAVPGSVNLVAISAAELSEGDYVATVVGRDRNDPARHDTVLAAIPIAPFDESKVLLSDLELANSILEGSEGSPFYKNTLEVIPNARGIFGGQQLCYLYAEVYNLQADTSAIEYFVKTVVVDAARREVISRKKPRKRTSESAVIVDQIVVGRMHTGTYSVGVMIVDSADNILSSASKRLFVYNEMMGMDSTLAQPQVRGLASLYASMSEGDLDQEFSYARYEARDEDKRQYEALTGVDAKRVFLEEFWSKRPLGLREEYLQRVEFANRYYRVLGRPGYRTDRGRVHIVYGPPNDYDRHPNEPQSRPYETWTYEEIQGGVMFVFVQRVVNGEYELVHSTHRNEIHDDQWYARFAQPSY